MFPRRVLFLVGRPVGQMSTPPFDSSARQLFGQSTGNAGSGRVPEAMELTPYSAVEWRIVSKTWGNFLDPPPSEGRPGRWERLPTPIPHAAGGEGGHGAARPHGVIHGNSVKNI